MIGQYVACKVYYIVIVDGNVCVLCCERSVGEMECCRLMDVCDDDAGIESGLESGRMGIRSMALQWELIGKKVCKVTCKCEEVWGNGVACIGVIIVCLDIVNY